MKQNAKQQRQQFKEQTASKNFRYNRYLLLRYMLALFFFVNMYWTLGLLLSGQFSALLPGFLLVFSIKAIAEHVKLYNAKKNDLPQLRYNRLYHLVQLGVNLLMLLVALTGIAYPVFFPFLETTFKARMIVASVVLLGAAIAGICLKRIQSIEQNTDKHYQYIKEFEKTMKFKEE